eukprot:CAMPEP_0180475638 /NCGR_PEP_ID=MMETSP1036_2-20121128/31308_1 /TAXON_ID=632150 /ORGANISM="Azadinium spinosum, Strain 3D9" /LENGTH=428 /DNA_ID=CAMNT_0022483017 /DNA_START=86 /DNA_END=1368 /DNA_ORIENTATION=+
MSPLWVAGLGSSSGHLASSSHLASSGYLAIPPTARPGATLVRMSSSGGGLLARETPVVLVATLPEPAPLSAGFWPSPRANAVTSQGGTEAPLPCDAQALSVLARRGVHPRLRPKVWSHCLEGGCGDAVEEDSCGVAEGGGSAASDVGLRGASAIGQERRSMSGGKEEVSRHIADLIETDIPRTFARCKKLQTSVGQNKLRHALRRFAAENADIGYCQSLNLLAGVLIMVFDDERAVPALMSRLIAKLDARRWYTEGMQQLRADAIVLQDLLRERMPIIHAAFSAHSFDPLVVCPRWFLSLFSMALEGETLHRVWDVVLSDGISAVFRVAVALFARREAEIKRASSLEDLMNIFLTQQQDVVPESVLAIAYHPNILGRLDAAELAERRQVAWRRIQEGDLAEAAEAAAAAATAATAAVEAAAAAAVVAT